MQVRDEDEGNDICDRLRAVGIKCAVEPLPDMNSLAPIMGGPAGDVLTVLVNESDLEKARGVVSEYQESLRQPEEPR
jgi:cell division septation protein DedD